MILNNDLSFYLLTCTSTTRFRLWFSGSYPDFRYGYIERVVPFKTSKAIAKTFGDINLKVHGVEKRNNLRGLREDFEITQSRKWAGSNCVELCR